MKHVALVLFGTAWSIGCVLLFIGALILVARALN